MKLLRNQFSLANLQVFVVVARLGSFTRAAEHIHLTQSAVSKQVAALEDAVGVALFVRAGGVRLTPAGREFFEKVEPALGQISRAVESLSVAEEGAVVSILAPPAVLQYWLISLIPDFVNAHPEIDLRLSPSLVSTASTRLDVDAEVRFGTGVWQGVRASYLFGREMCVVASPAWLDRHPVRTPAELKGVRVFGHRLYPTAWAEWCKTMDTTFAPRDVQAYDHYSVMIEAVLAGLGVGIVPRLLVRKFLADGLLVVPFNEVMMGTSGYYLVLSGRDGGCRHVKTVGDWIRHQARVLSEDWLDAVDQTVRYVKN